MLSLLLTPADGGTPWRQLLRPGEARAGWECLGPLGLARRIGRLLGHPAEPAPRPDRAAAWAARVDRLDDGRRSYSASRRADPFGVASFLLSLRDRLRLAGWSGGPLDGSARLRDLAAIEALEAGPVPPGLADRLEELAEAAERAGRLPLELSLELAAPREGFAPRLLRLVDSLERAGARVVPAAPDAAAAPPGSDLGRLQRALLDPALPPARLEGDGSLLLLEADTPVEAGELAAGILRRWPLAEATAVVAAGASALDAALARQGLPTLGLGSPSRLRPHLQVLPLRLALAFRPRDPFRAAELLLLPGAPLPGHARAALLGALRRMPGIGSPAWRRAVDQAAEREERRATAGGAAAGQALRDRIDAWFGGEDFDPLAGIPAARAAGLCGTVGDWAGARAGRAEERGDGTGAGLWSHAAVVARALQRALLALPPDQAIPQLALAQLHDVAAGAGPELSAFGGESGRPAVCTGPAEVLPGSSSVLWFGFALDASPGPAPEPWTGPERDRLLAAGLRLPAPGEVRGLEARGWRRPLLLARERAALVRWRLDGPEPVGPHPLLDELRIRAAPGSLEACALGSERVLAGGAALALATCELPAAPAVAPRPVWTVPPRTLEPRGPLSPTGLEALLGCPFRWALEHQAQLRPGRGVDIPGDARLLGDFAHRILQDLLLSEGRLDLARASPEEAAARARDAFDARAASEAAPLLRPGSEVERDAARSLVAAAAAALVTHLRAGGWTPRAAEAEVAGTFSGYPLRGYVDLVLERDGAPGLIDLKLSGSRYRREELEQGQGLQIALYASMLRRGPELPPSGFLILSEGELLTLTPGAFPGSTAVDGPSARETLRTAEELFASWRRVLARGVLPLCADDLPWAGPAAEAGGPPPDAGATPWRDGACRFCRFTTLCRARVGEEPAP